LRRRWNLPAADIAADDRQVAALKIDRYIELWIEK